MFITQLLFTIPVKNIQIKTAFQKYYKESIKIIFANSLKHCCYLIFTIVIVNYKNQVLIIGIKINV